MSNLSDIITVNIDIASPGDDSASFDNLLILGPGPKYAPSSPPPAVAAYSGLGEVNDAGWLSIGEDADPVGVAAMVAFSQSPSPSAVYIAVQQTMEKLISDLSVQFITIDNYREFFPGEDTSPEELPWMDVSFDQADLTGGELTITVEKDDALVYGGNLNLVKGEEPQFRAVVGIDPTGERGFGIDQEEIAGLYTVTLEASLGGRVCTAMKSVQFDGSQWEEVAGTEPDDELEHPTVTLSRALATTGWYVICTAGIPEEQYEEIAQWTEAQTKQFLYTYLGDEDPVGDVYYRTHGWHGKEYAGQPLDEVPAANRYMNVAVPAKILTAHESGSETWAYKTLAGVYPATLTKAEMESLKAANLNYYTTYANKNVTQHGKVKAGEWIDVIRFRDWLQNDMQLRIFNLFLLLSKLPFVDKGGINLVENEMIACLKGGVQRGGIAPDEYDEDGNLVPGFTVTVPLAASLTAAQKASRVLTGCKFTARLAGAIHAAELDGKMTY